MIDAHVNMEEFENSFAEWKKPDKKEYIVWDSSYIKF